MDTPENNTVTFPLSERARQDLDHRFTYHPPSGSQPERYIAIREKAKELALLVAQSCPESREKALAMTRIEEAVMWANAGVARNG